MTQRKLTQDEIGKLPQQELEQRYRGLVSFIERERRKGRNHPELEVDACFFYRELEHRTILQQNHELFLQNRFPSAKK